ncbi:hypothetical protein ALC53_05366 [Atta colombica]|uniref:Uncharacterized protein n=1 Tax=Atta colombica TaxID=520822 RepID=A0A195BHH7_9HYME|nr:hypothetical protein ALC53_05366 [Atta colombica]
MIFCRVYSWAQNNLHVVGLKDILYLDAARPPSRVNSAFDKVFPLAANLVKTLTSYPAACREAYEDSAALPPAVTVLARDRISTGAEDGHSRAA